MELRLQIPLASVLHDCHGVSQDIESFLWSPPDARRFGHWHQEMRELEARAGGAIGIDALVDLPRSRGEKLAPELAPNAAKRDGTGQDKKEG